MDITIIFQYVFGLFIYFFGLEVGLYGSQATFGQVFMFGALTTVIYSQAKRYMSHG